ncbi:Hypothetical protein Cul210932_0231 [Corynebacterium ulcerans]|uniref:Transposase n=1 Tax=Corynebacterium ulcerans FRC58 TaxID=1408268 RepID=A0ABM5TY73_CORUL|nr:Hypothetical protein Cul210932_0231 [Corynebacterium ulcerans]AIU90832.1 Hypothetical protein Cul05146_0238 [Corynebacterium ulcerans]AKN76079.1 Hypothetical protein CulFRC58_0225 [Corynebacterium ulcerans FRC58]ALD93969.1 Hypothetical protein Cul131001_0235 [Corynebacterium ulcerans]
MHTALYLHLLLDDTTNKALPNNVDSALFNAGYLVAKN